MARPLRIDRAGGWYHVTCRGNERRNIFRDDRDREHFLELLGELVIRLDWRIHSHVLMDNHYHLEVQIPQANLSAGMHWLQLSYSVWFNRRHHRVGHLFQGRFKAILLDPEEWGVRLSHYIHLNPVRVARFGLNKASRARQRIVTERKPDRPEIGQRLEVLRNYRWSSYRAYAGLEKAPPWLECGWVLGRMGASKESAQRRAYRQESEALIEVEEEKSPWTFLEGGILLGAKQWVEARRRGLKGNEKEQTELRALKVRPPWEAVVLAVEEVKGEKWDGFRDRYGDWGRDVALLLGRRECGLKLEELGKACGGLDYRSVGSAVKKAMDRLRGDRDLMKTYESVRKRIETKKE